MRRHRLAFLRGQRAAAISQRRNGNTSSAGGTNHLRHSPTSSHGAAAPSRPATCSANQSRRLTRAVQDHRNQPTPWLHPGKSLAHFLCCFLGGPPAVAARSSELIGAGSRVSFRDCYCDYCSVCCETLWTLPLTSMRYHTVKLPGGNPSLCPSKTTSSSCELIHRFALRYECPAFKNCAAVGSPARTTLARSVSFKVVGSYR